MANCWSAIIAEASRQAAGRKMDAGGRVLLLAANTMPVGELDHPLTLVACWSFQCDENLLSATLCYASAMSRPNFTEVYYFSYA